MNYHLSQGGKDVGAFPLEELKRRRDAGELLGSELVWTQGMSQWQPLDSILSGEKKSRSERWIVVVVIFIFGFFLVGAVGLGVMAYKFFQPTVRQFTGESKAQESSMQAATRPVVYTTNSITQDEAQKADRAFRVRQYIVGYQTRGIRNPECDLLAQRFLTNWICDNYGGAMDTNLPSLAKLSDQLANDPNCQDPLILTIAAINTVELHEAIRRLERAVKGFENSRHHGYPAAYANTELAEKLIEGRSDRIPVLDAQALQDWKSAFADGSVASEDQDIVGDIMINGWASDFFKRNAAAMCALVKDQGTSFKWLALVLDGENNINEAWSARGGGYANSVSDAGWKGFNEHLANARRGLSEAWRLRPDWPLAPDRMIYVSLGDSGIGEMRKWFDRTTTAQIDYADAWEKMRWGLRRRWYGDVDSLLAFGETGLKTRRFDTLVPRVFYQTLGDVESDMDLQPWEHIYGRADIWPRLQEMYEGYVNDPSLNDYSRGDWRSGYAVVSYLAGKYDVSAQQLAALHWHPHPENLTGWYRDLSLLPQEVAARTGPLSAKITEAESLRNTGDAAGALQIYQQIAPLGTNGLTQNFIQDRLATLALEKQLQSGNWVDFLPSDTNFTGWQAEFGNFKRLSDGSLEVQSDEHGHLMYSRARVGTEFEVRGQFEVVSSTSTAFQGGLVMGVPQYDTYDWYAFRIKRNTDEGDVASFSQHWTSREIRAPASVDSHLNSFDFTFHAGRVSATVNGNDIFKEVPTPRYAYVGTNEFLLGVGAFNDSNSTVIRYRKLQVRRLGT